MKKKQKTILLLALISLLAVSCKKETKQAMTYAEHPVDYVSTLVGTASTYQVSTGNTYPATGMPWGMNFWTPQTGRNGDGWQYTYNATHIRGLKQTHQPSPWINDYGEFSLMPVTTEAVMNEDERASWFSHKAETATPYYYSVYLADHDVTAELTPTEHAAAFRLTYPERELSYLVVDAYDGGSYVKLIPEENKIVGYTTKNHGGVMPNFKNWFVILSDTPFSYWLTAEDGHESEALEAHGNHAQALVGFPTSKGQQVQLQVASSFISLEQAEQNLQEVIGQTFDGLKQAGRDRWNEVLGRIRIGTDSNDRDLRTFYSCLYRVLLFPRDLSEIDANGRRLHYSPYNGQIAEGYLFTDTGVWDTFRCLLPLLNLIYPDQSAKIQEGLVNAYKESGFLPEWASPGHRDCMVGNNSASVVADAYLSGVQGYDAETLWQAVTHGAHSEHPTIGSTGRKGYQYYDSLGYVPANVGIRESAARTLEYAYDDWCIYTFGKALGKSEAELAPYKKAATNYQNLYHADYRLMVGRNADGTFHLPFNPLKWGGDFTEGNSLHYTWSVFHDPAGLINLMGGEASFNQMLDSVFTIPPLFDESYYGSVIHEIREMQIMNMGNYAHGNQPIQHMIYLYDWSGEPWKAQAHIREVMQRFYTADPDGYCGDEDNGQTSAWYVFSALGFYPVCPASGEYAIGTPLFREALITMPDGQEVRISAPENSRDNCFVQGITLNGSAWDKNFFRQADLKAGAQIQFSLASTPNKERGTQKDARPYSLSEE